MRFTRPRRVTGSARLSIKPILPSLQPASPITQPIPPMPAHRVADTSVPPRSAVGYLYMQWNTGIWYSGSASLLNNQYILTCSHNLVDPITNRPPIGYAVRMFFYPAFNRATDEQPPADGLTVKTGFYSNRFAGGEDAW